MLRSRLIFVVLFLAYLGVTPAGVYTCVCLVPVQPAPQQAMTVDEMPQQFDITNAVVVTLVNYFSLAFLVTAAFLLAASRSSFYPWRLHWQQPLLFSEPPPTPPPHFA
ncbi:hypothetical protein [Candidatus Leptofilum sp.]|uniref:hypothetical protein n=1 Tax=Candidatus Leptofilum sp. TaxID=3241576 RepID=UPI003B5CD6FE